MIKLQFSPSSFENLEIKVAKTVNILKTLDTPTARTEISKAIFTITTKKFLKDISLAAKADIKKFHHLYEWRATGIQKEKLFIVKRSKVAYGNMIIEFIPLKSVRSVPIPEELMRNGRTGKHVIKKSIFKNKAEVIEEGRSVSFTTRKHIVFLDTNGEKVFLPKNKAINIKNPGGSRARHALREFSTAWYAKESNGIIARSGLFKLLGREVAKVANIPSSNSSMAQAAIRTVTSKYSEGKVVM